MSLRWLPEYFLDALAKYDRAFVRRDAKIEGRSVIMACPHCSLSQIPASRPLPREETFPASRAVSDNDCIGSLPPKTLSWLQAIVATLLGGVAGAVAGVTLLYGLTYSLTRFFFPAALLSASYLSAMDGTNMLGVLLGGVTGLAMTVPRENAYLRKVVAGLVLWIGASATVPTLAFLVISAILTLRGNPKALAGMAQPVIPVMVCLELPILLWGVLLLRWGLKVVVNRSPGAVWASFVADVRAVCMPRPDWRLETYTMSSAHSVETCLERLASETDVERGVLSKIRLALPLPGRKPVMVTIRPASAKPAGVYSMSSIPMSQEYQCRFRQRGIQTGYIFDGLLFSSAGETRLTGSSELPVPVFAFLLYWFGFLALVTVIFTLAFITALFSLATGGSMRAQNHGFALAVMSAMWLFGLLQLRFWQWRARQQELFIIALLQEILEGELIVSNPRRKRLLLF
jgi:hypothetical protein